VRMMVDADLQTESPRTTVSSASERK